MKTAITLLLFFSLNVLSAQSSSISGTVESKSNREKIAFASVSVFDATTKSFVKATTTDEKGNFSIPLTNVAFFVQIEMIGYKTFESKTLTPTKGNLTQNFELEEDVQALKEVVVMHNKSLIKLSRDKMIFDIDKAGFGNGNDALETLSKLPGVQLDKDENVVFRGSNNLQIMIDGKPSLLTGEELKQYLKTLDGANIKAVEIIANPSAKYDAAGSAGIFNIVLKKSAATGLTGNIRSSIGYAEFIKNYNGLNLYNNTEKWNLKFGLNQGYAESINRRNIDQTVVTPTLTTTLLQKNDWLPVSNSYSGNFGASHQLNKNATVGASTNYSIYKSDEKTNGRTEEFDNAIYERYTILNTQDDKINKTLTSTLFYNFASDSLDTKIDAQLSYANYQNDSDRLTSNAYFNANTNAMYKNSEAVKFQNPTNFNIVNAKVDFEKKISKTFNFETGSKLSYVNNDYTIKLQDRDDQGNFVLNTNPSNHLVYKESILSGYGITNFTKGKFDIQAGLRAEYINYNATSLTSNSSNKDNYLSLFPSFSVNGNFNNNQYKFSYSRRIQRPRYLALNPYYEYIDTYNVSVGNPNLTPQFTDAFELVWIKKQKTSVSLYANFSRDEIYQIIAYNPDTKITTLFSDNIGKSKSIGLSFNTSYAVKKWWEVQLNTEVAYGQATSNLEGYRFNNSGVSFSGALNQSFTLAKDWSATWNSFYSQNGNYGNTSFKPSYDMSFSMRKDFLSKKLRMNLSAQNVLKKSQWIQSTQQDNVTTNWVNRWETRKVTLSLTYNFGTAKKKEVKDADLNEEQNRL
ncbi:outer membrane beta-barrel family protein [Flavobacterium sp.]|uniref:outer membrane beta-barrel family protein n=1 Tax=Flavobacterium sp. TaxID=239 RepID=UPI0026057457|nr:outer membrane beta-barrel family protein [Flavobacterium sp.]MDG2430921.1 outer membrane beta-barrel family protein [Flavobacterium sp.]